MRRKRLIAVLTAATLIIGCVPSLMADETGGAEEEVSEYAEEYLPLADDVSDYEYEELNDGTIWIKSYNGNAAELIIPEKIDGKAVTKLGYNVEKGNPAIFFRSNNSTKSVTIPDTVSSIENGAFYGGSALMEINVSENNPYYTSKDGVLYRLRNDDLYIFAYPAGKTDDLFVAPDTVKGVESWAFVYSKVKSITLPDSMTSADACAFAYSSDLTSINIPTGLTFLAYRIFEGCESLKNIVIPDNIIEIEHNAFTWCKLLEKIIIPDSVTEIGGSAFAGCTSLTSVSISSSVTEISSSAFSNCTSLAEINVNSGNESYASIDGVLFKKNSGSENISLLRYPPAKDAEFYQVPEKTDSISEGAFGRCTYLKSISIQNGITEIERYTFDGCMSLASVIIPDSVTKIGSAAFQSCHSLTLIYISENVKAIDDCVFLDCNKRNLVIYGISGSYAETYANDNNIRFNSLKSVNANDSALGIEALVPVSVPSSAVLNIKKISADEKSETYDISLTADGKNVDLNGEKSMVKIPVFDEENKLDYKVYRKETNGRYTDMEASVSNEYYVFTTDHFSEYIITTEKLIPDYIIGDVNGNQKVNSEDVILLNRYLAEWGNEIDETAADVNGDGKIDPRDSIALARMLLD